MACSSGACGGERSCSTAISKEAQARVPQCAGADLPMAARGLPWGRELAGGVVGELKACLCTLCPALAWLGGGERCLEWMGPGVRALEWLAWGCVGQEGGEAG